MNKRIDFYYFSGTGNTQLIVDHAVDALTMNGCSVSVKHIEKGYTLSENEPAEQLWFAFPVNSQAVSPFIWRFFRSLPQSSGTKVYVIATLNNSAYILNPLFTLLKNKGYTPASACEISMPNNMGHTQQSKENDLHQLIAACDKVNQFVSDSVTGKVKWDLEYKGSSFVSFLSRRTVLPWMSMRLLLKLRTEPSQCTGCGLCVRQCPVQNISITGHVSVHGNKCEFCMKCAASCPKKAIYISGKPKIKIRSTKMPHSTIQR
ncbi:EFR1 family ferrodoxin [Paenibacillus tianjinensis]|uniref:4Fe-4S dicluster domain-containing protein n=1 Tax=Paenibacillus tianjinensis TaxID=2810347 RepID=A0ABX7L8B2_9BACL|nr:EFR1 family ferrodoxin [Paenibacillus tianjinensis]QSF44445.1 4Fe-4S dicluster domain-containing protein [Paenibacillus tianjinensis]